MGRYREVAEDFKNIANSVYEAFGYTWKETDEPENVDTEYTWDDENRLKQTDINGMIVQYQYNAGGDRTSKLAEGKTEVLYVDRLYQLQIGVYKDCITRHIFVGETRIVSKITYEDLVNNAEVERNNTYFYHPDHLGSSNIITDNNGYEYEHLEYTPYGETWFEESQEPMLNKIAYKFTGKELDTETGLYYFGARYYDPKTSRWISTDPLIPRYLPTGDKKNDNKLPGEGGVFNHLNLNLYHYSFSNPINYFDPNGLEGKEKVEQLARSVAVASSITEIALGIILIVIPEPGTTGTGIFMVVHGLANLGAASYSVYEYETSNGNNEVSTSLLGIAFQKGTLLFYADSNIDFWQKQQIAAMWGSSADIADAVLSSFLCPKFDTPTLLTKILKDLAKVNTIINASGDLTLGATTFEDFLGDPLTPLPSYDEYLENEEIKKIIEHYQKQQQNKSDDKNKSSDN